MLVTEAFKQFCKERHAENKGKNFNLLQEIYANTELFDISLYDFSKDFENCKIEMVSDVEKKNKKSKLSFVMLKKDIALPFKSIFIKVERATDKEPYDSFLFINEETPTVLTGSVITTEIEGMHLVTPFKIEANTNNVGNLFTYFILMPIDEAVLDKSSSKEFNSMIIHYFRTIFTCLKVVSDLSNKAVVSDTPTTTQYEYYRRKHAEAIKKPVKPIYYVLAKKEETVKHKYNNIRAIGKLEFNHSFKVRGHWRRISEKSYGKDRNGEYNILGHTWVTEYVKGEGELVKKLRVIK